MCGNVLKILHFSAVVHLLMFSLYVAQLLCVAASTQLIHKVVCATFFV